MYFFLLVANFLVALVTSNGGASAIWRSIYQQHAVGFQSLSSAAPSYFQLGDDGEEASPSSSTVFGDVQPGSSPSADPSSSSSSEISDDSRPGSPSRIDDDYEQLVSVVVGPGCHRRRLRRRGADRSSPGAVNGDFSKSYEPVWSGASTFQIVQEACQDAGQSWKEGPKDGGFPAYTTLSRNSSTWNYSFDQDGRRRRSASSLEPLPCFLTVSHAEFVGNFSHREEHASCLSTGNSSGGGNSTFSLHEIPAELLEKICYDDECCFAILAQTKYDDFGGAENLDDEVGTGDEAKKLPPIEQLDEEIEANLHEETLKQEIRKNSGSFTKTVLFAIFVLSIPSFGVVLASAAKNAYEFLFFLEFCGSFGFRFHLGPVKVHFSFSYCIYGPGIDTESLDE